MIGTTTQTLLRTKQVTSTGCTKVSEVAMFVQDAKGGSKDVVVGNISGRGMLIDERVNASQGMSKTSACLGSTNGLCRIFGSLRVQLGRIAMRGLRQEIGEVH